MSTPAQVLPFAFPILFAGMWLLVVTVLSAVSGWKSLQTRYPDRQDEVLATFPMTSGVMGAVNMNGILTLTACRAGLRVAIWRVFGPFDRPFFVPWDQIGVERRRVLFLRRAVLQFGSPLVGSLQISGGLADRLAATAQARWPERSQVRAAPTVS